MNLQINSYGQGQALVLFHGWGFDGHIWQSLLPVLENKFQVFTVDLPGFGLSSMMEWPDFKKQLLSILPAQFNMIGWSMGGLYATRLALENPERVLRLINCCSSPCFIAKDSWPGVPAVLFQGFYKNLTADLQNTLNSFVSLQTNKKKLELRHQKLPSFTALESGLKMLETWDLRPTLNELQMPTHYLFGRLDPITPVRTMEAMQTNFPMFDYILFKKSAHMPFLSEQFAFVQLLEDLLT